MNEREYRNRGLISKRNLLLAGSIVAVLLGVLIRSGTFQSSAAVSLASWSEKILDWRNYTVEPQRTKRFREQRVFQFNDPRLQTLFHRRFTPEAKVDEFSDFLTISGETPESLALVALATRDPAILMKLEEHTSNPMACQVLFMHSGSPIDRLRWADSMIACDGDNLMGYLYKAKALFELGEREKGLLAFNQGKGLHPLDRLSPVLTLTAEAAQAIPPIRALEIAHADSIIWAQEAVRPAVQSISTWLQIEGSVDKLSEVEVVRANDLLNAIADSSDSRMEERVQGIVLLERLKVATRLDSKDATKGLFQSLGTVASLDEQIDLHAQKERDNQMLLLSPMNRQKVDSYTLNWFTKPHDSTNR